MTTNLKGAYIHPANKLDWHDLIIILEHAKYGDYTDLDLITQDSVLAIYAVAGEVFHFNIHEILPAMQILELSDVIGPEWIDFGSDKDKFLNYAQELLNNINQENNAHHQ